MVDEKIDEKEANELKSICNYNVDKGSDIMKNTQFNVEDVFGDLIGNDNMSQDQIIKLNIFSAKMIYICSYQYEDKFFKASKKDIENYQPGVPPEYSDF